MYCGVVAAGSPNLLSPICKNINSGFCRYFRLLFFNMRDSREFFPLLRMCANLHSPTNRHSKVTFTKKKVNTL